MIKFSFGNYTQFGVDEPANDTRPRSQDPFSSGDLLQRLTGRSGLESHHRSESRPAPRHNLAPGG